MLFHSSIYMQKESWSTSSTLRKQEMLWQIHRRRHKLGGGGGGCWSYEEKYACHCWGFKGPVVKQGSLFIRHLFYTVYSVSVYTSFFLLSTLSGLCTYGSSSCDASCRSQSSSGDIVSENRWAGAVCWRAECSALELNVFKKFVSVQLSVLCSLEFDWWTSVHWSSLRSRSARGFGYPLPHVWTPRSKSASGSGPPGVQIC